MRSNEILNKRIPINHPRWSFLEVSLYYSLGGTNLWSYKTEPRGYWLGVTPCVSERPGIIMSSPMDGAKCCVLEVGRKSDKAAAKAIGMIDEPLSYLTNVVCEKIGAIAESA